MMQQKVVNFAIAGTGSIAETHARAILNTAGARLVAVSGRNEENRVKFASQWKVPYGVTSPAELALVPDIDVVCVTTPSGTHLEAVRVLAEAGKHVLVEKPLEISLDRVKRMIKTCQEHRVMLGGIFQSRFGPGAQAVKEAITNGRFGQLVLCSAYVKWFRSPEYYSGSTWKGTLALDGGGALMNQGIHAVDLLGWFGGDVEVTKSIKTKLVHRMIEVEDTIVACLKFDNGALGVIEASTAIWPGEPKRIEIRGERGAVTLEDDRILKWSFADPCPGDEEILAKFGSSTDLRSGASDPKGIGVEGHQKHIQNFVEVLRGEAELAVSASEASRSVGLIEAIYQSAEN